jgi:uncharacterized membrane protein
MSMSSLVAADQSFLLWGVIFAVVAFAMYAEETAWGRKVSGTIIAIFTGFLLSNLGIIPAQSPVYETTWSVFVPLAIPLLLVRADLRVILKESGPTLIAFLFGAVGTVAGALIGLFVITLPDIPHEITAILSASYIGGSMNFAAVSEALGVAGHSLIGPLVAADNIVGTTYLMILAILPASALFTRLFPNKHVPAAAHTTDSAVDEAAPQHAVEQKPFGLFEGAFEPKEVILALVIAYFIVALGEFAEELSSFRGTSILVITALSVFLASAMPEKARALRGVFPLGMVIMYIFFTTIGASANLWSLIDSAPVLLIFATTICLGNFTVAFAGSRMCGLTLAEAITGANACAMGPSTAAGLAAGKGWDHLVTPGILVGILGYAIANFVGIALAGLLG